INTLGLDESMIKYIKDRPGHDKRYAMSNDKISEELGWYPKMPFEKGIDLTINWYLKNRNLL
ncbi:MAG: GDP-mannose 4,6-dehydratase, partial [Clostridia bacterium]|nr:GDP-mannose 4,6-dehydratase [Clostridia bacterium]